MSSPVVSSQADLSFYQDETNFTSKKIYLTESLGLNSDKMIASLENGISMLFSDKEHVTPSGFIHYIDNYIVRTDPAAAALSSSLSFNLPEGIINVVGSGIGPGIDSEGFWSSPTVHTIVGGAGKFLGKTGFAVVEGLDNSVNKAYVWKVFFTN